MSNHYFTPNLIGTCKKQHQPIVLICLLIFIVSSQTVSAQQQIAQDVYAIFERTCFGCHGPDGAFKETLLIEHNALIDNEIVVPGNPNTSELYNRLITTDTAKRMPLNQPPLSTQAINTIRNWILAGAPDWTATATTNGNFISTSEVLNTIETHLMSLPSFDRAFARYFTMTHLYNAGETAQVLESYRNGLYKLVNSLSWGGTVINPEPIHPQGTIFYIDLRHYEWDVNDGWGQIEAAYPYHISFDAPTQTALKEQLGRLQTEMNSSIPSIHVDWFVATASSPPLYHDLLSLPLTDRALETRLGVDVLRNISSAPGVRVWRAGFNNSGVSNNNRMVERHASQHGAYWKSYDFAGNVGTQNIFNHPLAFTHDGGEVIFNLPNGLQGYYLVNASGFRLDAAPINIVSNPAASDPTVRNGISCLGCHTEGMKTFEDQVRSVIESNTNPTYDKAQALRLYVEKSKMDALVTEDMERYRVALDATGGTFDDIEPISRFHEAFQGDVDAAYAAAVVGLETEAFLEKIRENVGLQNAGLLVLDSPSGSVKRDAWTSSFRDIVFALDFPKLVDKPPVVPEPDKLPGGFVHIPDSNLRAAIAEALGKSPTAPITAEEMEGLTSLEAPNRGIQDLTGIQFATNLDKLNLGRWGDHGNQVSDLSPIAGLTKLRRLYLNNNSISDLSPIEGLINLRLLELRKNPISDFSVLRGLTNLTKLTLQGTLITDLSPISGLTNLTNLNFQSTSVSDLSPVAGLINITELSFSQTTISDLSPVVKLTNLESIFCWGHEISDLSPLADKTKLREINFCGGNISNLTPLAGLTGLKELYLAGEKVSDISLLAGLINLTRLSLDNNDISDISPLAGLTNLKWLHVGRNNISDLSPLDGLRENIKLIWFDNPAFPKGGPKIEGPWLWVIVPLVGQSGVGAAASGIDFLAQASDGAVTEVKVATDGATAGVPVGESLWTVHKISPIDSDNLNTMANTTGLGTGNMNHHIAYGSITLYSPREQETWMFAGSNDAVKVWLNGQLLHTHAVSRGASDYQDMFPVTLKQGRNVLLVGIYNNTGTWSGFFGFEPGTEYTVANPAVSYTLSKTPIHRDDTFTLDILAENITDLAGWQFDIAFDPAILEAINVTEGDFLKTDGGTTFFQSGSIDNASGKITGLSAARLSAQGVSGTGVLLQVRFKAKSGGETELALQNFEFGTITGENIPAGPHEIRITVEGQLATGDVNRDGRVSILDLILVAQQLGKRVPANSPVDLNRDGVVSILDLILAAQGIGNTTTSAAPAIEAESVDPATIEAWIAQARLEDDGSLAFKQGIENLEALLRSLIPEETALLANYPNPFNPETWIPYQLAESAEVTLTIYDINGQLVRRLVVGHQAAGMYRSRSRAVYWDGRNQLGESVASGLYFYTLTAGEFTATRRMLILK